jgi:hypothetical protein
MIRSLALAQTFSRAAMSEMSMSANCCRNMSSRPEFSRKREAAEAVTAKPLGVGSPTLLWISPRFAAFPPTSSRRSRVISSSGRMSVE